MRHRRPRPGSAASSPVAKPVKRELPPTEFPNIGIIKGKPPEQPEGGPDAEANKKAWAEYEKKHAEFEKQFDPPKLPDVRDTDRPLVRLTKHKLKAVLDAQRAFRGRIDGGISTSFEFASFCELSTDLTATVDLLFETPADRLPWYEYRVLMMKMGEQYYFARANFRDPGDPPGKQGIDPPYLLPRATAARLDAEIALCQLKAKIAK